jgi:hypothetical protein
VGINFIGIFYIYFSKQFSGRKLTWLHHLSNGDVKLGYSSKTYIINMTTTQVQQDLHCQHDNHSGTGTVRPTLST